jgi:hypothetical protein
MTDLRLDTIDRDDADRRPHRLRRAQDEQAAALHGLTPGRR